MEQNERGTLYLVGTPIGNLGDMTFRAVETLKRVDCIACEDTRHSLGLLNYYDIKKPLFACHKFNERESAQRISDYLAQGKNVALITDAGMPAVSDPGAIVVEYVRQLGGAIQVVPAASAVTAALALSGIVRPIWTFLGFLPEKKKDRAALLQPFVTLPSALIFYCSPYDINRDLADLAQILGNRRVHVIKEITKMHERHEIYELNDCRIETPKGEYVLIVEHPSEAAAQVPEDSEDAATRVRRLMGDGVDKKEAIKRVAKERRVPKDDIYKAVLAAQDADSE